jgi:hypothetical protein
VLFLSHIIRRSMSELHTESLNKPKYINKTNSSYGRSLVHLSTTLPSGLNFMILPNAITRGQMLPIRLHDRQVAKAGTT